MGRFYIHKVGHQEMGSINRRGEKPARGRYFLIAKTCLDFFPHISSVVMNDKVIRCTISHKMTVLKIKRDIAIISKWENKATSDRAYRK